MSTAKDRPDRPRRAVAGHVACRVASPAVMMSFLGALVLTAPASALPSLFAPTGGSTRSLDLVNEHTEEKLTVIFKKDGHFVPSALAELNHFLRDWRRNEEIRMDPHLFDVLWEVYQKTGSHEPIHVVCGYRSLATNDMLHTRSRMVAKHSQHTLGKAMDIRIPGIEPETIREIALKMQEGGIGWYSPAAGNFSHIDVGSVRAWPRVPRSVLVRLFPDGKTVHIPADGRPLAGYEEAKAELAKRGIHAAGGGSEDDDGSGTATAVADNTASDSFLTRLFGPGGQSQTQAQTPAPAPAQTPAPVAAAAPAPSPVSAPKAEEKPAPQLAAITPPPVAAPAARPATQPDLVWQKGAEATESVASKEPPSSETEATAPHFAPPSVLPPARPALAPALASTAADTLVAVAAIPTVLPRAKPAGLSEAVLRPAEEAPPEFPVDRPATRQAEAASQQALALGYAPMPREPSVEDLVPRQAPRHVQAPARLTIGAAIPADKLPLIALGSPIGKGDPAAAQARGSLPSNLPLLDATTTTRRMEFARLTSPDPSQTPNLIVAPVAIISAHFSPGLVATIDTGRFRGSAIRPMTLIAYNLASVRTAQR